MSLFNTHTLTVERKDPGNYINGRWIEGEPDTFTINTSWQPATGKDLEVLEEGKRLSVTFKAFPNTELFAADPKTNREGDFITGLDGYKYEVVFVAPNQNELINHYKVLAVRRKENIESDIQ